MWYARPGEDSPALDFMGVHPLTLQKGIPLYCLALSFPLLLRAAAARRRQAYGR